jgi:trehalose/maltose hydrolase-like predicted phosphorylase
MIDVSFGNHPYNQQLLDTTDQKVIETKFDATQQHHQETIFSLSNGFLETRGTFEEGYPQDCQATLIQNIYDDVTTTDSRFVNCPDWLPLVVTVTSKSFNLQEMGKISSSERFSMDSGEIITYKRQLDLGLHLLSRDVRWRSPAGHTLDFHFERFTSLADQHVSAICCQITSIDFTGDITVEVGFNTKPDNEGIQHWRTLNKGGIDQIIWLQSQAPRSGIQLGMAAKLIVEGDYTAPMSVGNVSGSPTLTTTFQSFPGKTVAVEKIVTLFTSQDTEIPIAEALQRLADEPRYMNLLREHVAAIHAVQIPKKI